MAPTYVPDPATPVKPLHNLGEIGSCRDRAGVNLKNVAEVLFKVTSYLVCNCRCDKELSRGIVRVATRPIYSLQPHRKSGQTQIAARKRQVEEQGGAWSEGPAVTSLPAYRLIWA